ncbi:MAG TPA: DUF1801 domain-containing protein [Candidatus Polarisedimenticolaceae bacterium]|nr:DUF1801 domain-containing protein [Candidatus Polarisedimenticolaceae bacterium]
MARPPAVEPQIKRFIAKFDPPIAKLIRACRSALRRKFPTAHELVYDNYNFLVFGYCATERPSDCIVSLAANAKGAGLAFYHGATLPDPHKILLGSGKQNRFVRLPSAKTLEEPAVAALIRAALAQTKVPLPKLGRGPSVVRSVSAKQRPRSLRRTP